MDSVDDARLGYPRRSELRTPEGAVVPDTDGGWPPFAVVFALGAGVIALNVVLSLSAQAPGRSGLARLGGPVLAIAAAVGAVAVSRRAGSPGASWPSSSEPWSPASASATPAPTW